MASSKKATPKKTAKKANEQPSEATVPGGSPSGKSKKPIASVRRVPVQYTPRIPAARCPWC